MKANLLCMAAMLVWACGFPLIGLLLQTIPPVPLTAIRLVLAAAFLLALWLGWEGRQAVLAAPWGKGLWVGAIGFGLGALLLVYALKLTDPVTVAIISAGMPVVGIALECLLDQRRLTPGLLAGLLLSIGGGVIACAARLEGLGLGLGAAMALIATVVFSWGSRATVKEFPDLTPLGRTALTIVGATVLVAAIAGLDMAFGQSDWQWQSLNRREGLLLLATGIGSLALSQLLWIVGVGRLGVGIASMHVNAAPFYVMIFMLMLGSPWSNWQAFGALVVAAGVLVAQSGRTSSLPVPRWSAKTDAP